MKIQKCIEPHIFRGYDIRGIYGKDLNDDVAYTIGKAFGSYIQEIGKRTVVVGRDNRESSPAVSKALICGLTDSGADVVDIGLVTTPMYYFSWNYLNIYSGLMVTASHNPKEYNGFKFAFDESGNVYGEKIQSFRKYIEQGNFKDGKGTVINKDITSEYLNEVKRNIVLGDKKIKVIVDPGNGTGCIIVKKIFEMFDLDVKYICDESNPDFPYHHPDPSVEKNLDMLKKTVVEEKAMVGLALDGDADRIGIVDHLGNFLPVDLLLIILAREIIKNNKGSKILFDVKCTKAIEDDLESLGVEYERYRVGNSYIKAKMRDGGFALGAELSGHVFFRDRWGGFDDGIYAGLRLIEIMTKTGKTIPQLMEGIVKYYSTNEIKIKSTETEKYELVEKTKRYADSMGYKYSVIDGIRIENADWWALVRASQTGPAVTVRFEANSQRLLDSVKDEFKKILDFKE